MRKVAFSFKTIIVFPLIVFWLLVGEVSTYAATYYVATTGNDSFPGTLAQPFRSVRRGLSVLKPSDTLYIRAGTYAESINSNSQTLPTGTSWNDAPRISGYPGEAAILQLPSTQLPGTSLIDLQSGYPQYIVFANFVLDGGYMSTRVLGPHHVKFENMELKNAWTNCVQIGNGSHDIWFTGGRIHDCALFDTSVPTGYPFYIAGQDHLIENVEVYNSNRFCIHIYGGTPNRVTLRNSIFHHCALKQASAAAILAAGDSHMIYNNVVYNNSGHGIMTYGGTNTKFYNNTVYGNAESGIYVYPGSSNTDVRNNISYANRSTQIIDQGTGTILNKNLSNDPRFMNAATFDFNLQSSSPAIDAGDSLNQVTMDIRQRARPQGATHDIGAYEAGTTSTSAPSPPRNLSVR
jgi:parallel beta-helix repeat protein